MSYTGFNAFFDTNILAYVFSENEPEKQKIAKNLINKWRPFGKIVISTQVLQELFVVLTQKLKPPMNDDIAANLIREYTRLKVVNINSDLILKAIEIKKKYKFSFWDALIAIAALEAKCRYLFSEDLKHGMKLETLEIINPFQT
jgi:predicted nucleic acid-binding protein